MVTVILGFNNIKKINKMKKIFLFGVFLLIAGMTIQAQESQVERNRKQGDRRSEQARERGKRMAERV